MKKRIIPYNPKLKELAKKLRKQGILSEVLLWNELKGKKMMGYDFHRQKPIDIYIVDFFCEELNLVIEIDGGSHNDEERVEYDKRRQEKLESFNLTLLRFFDSDVRNGLDDVLEIIKEWIIEHEEINTDYNTPRPEGHPSPEGNVG
ncbi:MAG: endonuclease domain-containing protein [Ignavibacteria bacterium]